jgi:hypothetical protein
MVDKFSLNTLILASIRPNSRPANSGMIKDAGVSWICRMYSVCMMFKADTKKHDMLVYSR